MWLVRFQADAKGFKRLGARAQRRCARAQGLCAGEVDDVDVDVDEVFGQVSSRGSGRLRPFCPSVSSAASLPALEGTADEHGRDEPRRFGIARKHRCQGGAGAIAGQAPADAKQCRTGQ